MVDRFVHRFADRPKTVACKCGSRARPTLTSAKPDVWKPLTLEHINVEGEGSLTFQKKSDLRAYCEKHHLSSGALL